MNRNSAETSPRNIDTGSELSLSDFMLQNYNQDPEWFTEPENQPDYGPPGMPTPWDPSDPRIADRQRQISDELRGLLDPSRLPSSIDHHMIDMLQLNFDSFNTILGMNNKDGYSVWKSKKTGPLWWRKFSAIEEAGVLGLASQSEITEFMQHPHGIDKAELWRIYHPFKYRMRHIEHRRQETEEMILSAGGEVHDNTDGSFYYGLKLFPYVEETYRDLTEDESNKVKWLQRELKKQKLMFNGLANNRIRGKDNGSGLTKSATSVLNSISNSIDLYEKAIGEVHEGAQIHRTEALLASIKRDVGTIPKNDTQHIKPVERQLFAVDIASQKDSSDFQEAMRKLRLGQAADQSVKNIYMNVLSHFMQNHFEQDSQIIVPVSTTAYEFVEFTAVYAEKRRAHSLGAVGLGRSNRRLRR